MNSIQKISSNFRRSKRSIPGLAISVFIPGSVFAQSVKVTEPPFWSNPLLLTLTGVIILLLIVIAVLTDVLKNTAQYTKDENNKSGTHLGVITLLILMSSGAGFAQTVPAAADYRIGGLDQHIFYLLIAVIAIELLIISVLLTSVRTLLGIEEREAEKAALSGEKEELPGLIDKFNASVAIEEEAEIMFDHSYDGIRELDNDLPPWWKYGFYITIIWAVAYFTYYHISYAGDLQIAEYEKEIKKADADLVEYMKKAANLVDETNVTLLTDKASIEKGHELFMDNCAACHGRKGEGQVGPNLTDDYWIHGGSVKDIFKTIKYGFPDKGMKSWKDEISPSQTACITSYIKTLHGTNPPNAKAKQGDMYTEQAIVSDSLNVKTDSLIIKSDTIVKTEAPAIK